LELSPESSLVARINRAVWRRFWQRAPGQARVASSVRESRVSRPKVPGRVSGYSVSPEWRYGSGDAHRWEGLIPRFTAYTVLLARSGSSHPGCPGSCESSRRSGTTTVLLLPSEQTQNNQSGVSKTAVACSVTAPLVTTLSMMVACHQGSARSEDPLNTP